MQFSLYLQICVLLMLSILFQTELVKLKTKKHIKCRFAPIFDCNYVMLYFTQFFEIMPSLFNFQNLICIDMLKKIIIRFSFIVDPIVCILVLKSVRGYLNNKCLRQQPT